MAKEKREKLIVEIKNCGAVVFEFSENAVQAVGISERPDSEAADFFPDCIEIDLKGTRSCLLRKLLLLD